MGYTQTVLQALSGRGVVASKLLTELTKTRAKPALLSDFLVEGLIKSWKEGNYTVYEITASGDRWLRMNGDHCNRVAPRTYTTTEVWIPPKISYLRPGSDNKSLPSLGNWPEEKK